MWREYGVASLSSTLFRGALVRPKISLSLRQLKHLGAVGKHGRGFPRIEPPQVHFGDVSHELRFEPPGLLQDLSQAKEKLVIGNGCNRFD
jgi:hypothetical protein